MSESALASRIVKILKSLDALRVENPCHPGTPDVNYVGGWIELKQVNAWPKRASTPLRVEHFTAQQKIWLSRREECGGRAFVLLQVGREYLLLSGRCAAMILGEATQQELKEAALFVVDSRQLPEALFNACNN